MIRIRCVVERITFQNPENGYTVLKVAVKGYDELVTVVGNLLDANVGSVLLIEGNWKVDSKYGRQFMAETWEETLPATVYGIEKYLGSGLIKGVGPHFAKKIVALFGTDTIQIIEDSPDRLIAVQGIGKKRVAQIKESWEKQKEVKNIMLFLQGNGVSTSFAAKIYKTYGNESIDTVKGNPFRLADDIWGIGFKTADTIAEKLGFQKTDYVRCRSGIMYTLNALADEGHVYSKRDQLIEKAVELLDADSETLERTVDKMIEDHDLVYEGDAIYLLPFYYCECGTANKLRKIANSPASVGYTVPISIERIQQLTGMTYDDIQAEAIETALKSKVMVLTGGPGTGKTTTTQGIMAAMRIMNMQILLAAPTGRAAKRMSEATGMEAKTIHRLLEFKPPEGYKRNEDNPLEGDVLIVDEASMIDIVLMNSLMKAVPEGMRLILVGDIDQLPSVGAGNVLRDIIDSERFSVVRFTRLVLVGTQKALNYAVRNVTVTSRNTKLCERLGGKDTEQQREYDALFNRLALSDFRSRFKLDEKDIQMINEKGMDVIRSHAVDFVQKRLAPAVIPNDRKQTPMRGHPVFKAQHATACCCRGCLSKWHHIPAGVELTQEQQEYVVNVLMEWIGKKYHQ